MYCDQCGGPLGNPHYQTPGDDGEEPSFLCARCAGEEPAEDAAREREERD